ncbi:hypothetical protein GR925_30735 [Streptomyces sp. HUCO-GS316]|uniref:hypothetical protein n=1 Tax=Streptomyces sp. HUCO-GS316 TaxID=2692198 RepID=UPI00136E016D|nr:hypothetical protein [Streptomyces sp. HUCO-GS316]MXM67695.1 hypothetical protein [Streptomyces sp. HUCO-GS316]
MSENTAVTELTSHYTAQVTSDLEHNAKEQERIGVEIATLQEQLAALQRDHTVLVNIQRAIGTAPTPEATEPAAPADGSVVPGPRKKTTAKSATTAKSVKSATGKRARPKKTSAGTPPATVRKPATTKRAAKDTAAKTAQPTLVDLVRRHLTEQSEPRSAAEVATALGQTHPERTIKTTVVRTTLEGLVARTQAQRSKQGSSVFYTAPEAPEQTAAPQAKEEPAPAGA